MVKIKSDQLVDLVYKKVKQMILDGALIPGEKINKIELANVLGVSITPINEVVNRLTGEKLIDKVNKEAEELDEAMGQLAGSEAGIGRHQGDLNEKKKLAAKLAKNKKLGLK